ncbi:MAG: DUF169 domain-containing protein [Methanomassiliicoccales archaeon]|nr:DUF169 domain-containing protein [Methanomassiliicoccales archaeon]
MTDYGKCARVLMDVLELKTEPVAVTLIKKGESLSEGYQVPE